MCIYRDRGFNYLHYDNTGPRGRRRENHENSYKSLFLAARRISSAAMVTFTTSHRVHRGVQVLDYKAKCVCGSTSGCHCTHYPHITTLNHPSCRGSHVVLIRTAWKRGTSGRLNNFTQMLINSPNSCSRMLFVGF